MPSLPDTGNTNEASPAPGAPSRFNSQRSRNSVARAGNAVIQAVPSAPKLLA